MKINLLLLIALTGMILAGCTASPSASDNMSTHAPLTEEAIPTSPDSSSQNPVAPINTLDSSDAPAPPPEANPFVKLVEEDLAGRINTSLDQIHFLKISDIDWQDITQGCTGSPGQTLTKGRISGYRIWLEANDQKYLYHIGLDRSIFLCPE